MDSKNFVANFVANFVENEDEDEEENGEVIGKIGRQAVFFISPTNPRSIPSRSAKVGRSRPDKPS